MGVAGDGIDDEQHRLAPVAKGFRHRHRHLRGLAAHHRALVAGRDHDHRPGARLGDGTFEDFAHLAPALADQGDHDAVEPFRIREHGEQGRLADAAARKDADALPRAEGREQVEGPHPRHQGLAHPRPAEGGGRVGIEGSGHGPLDQGFAAVEGAAQRVDHPSLPARIRVQMRRAEAEDPRADARLDARAEGLDRRALGIDAHHLADLGGAVLLEAHPVAEAHERADASDAARAGRDLLHEAPDPHEVALRGGHGPFKLLERVGHRLTNPAARGT